MDPRGVLQSGDVFMFDEAKVPVSTNRELSGEDEYWQAEVTEMTGQQDNLKWLYTGDRYSFTGLTKEILSRISGRDKDNPLNGYRYWTHPGFDDRTLLELREANVDGDDRTSVE